MDMHEEPGCGDDRAQALGLWKTRTAPGWSRRPQCSTRSRVVFEIVLAALCVSADKTRDTRTTTRAESVVKLPLKTLFCAWMKDTKANDALAKLDEPPLRRRATRECRGQVHREAADAALGVEGRRDASHALGCPWRGCGSASTALRSTA